MRQSRMMSLVETCANVGVGYCLAVLTQVVLFPLFGIRMSLSDNLAIGLVFMAVSLLRGYALRRVFDWLQDRR